MTALLLTVALTAPPRLPRWKAGRPPTKCSEMGASPTRPGQCRSGGTVAATRRRTLRRSACGRGPPSHRLRVERGSGGGEPPKYRAGAVPVSPWLVVGCVGVSGVRSVRSGQECGGGGMAVRWRGELGSLGMPSRLTDPPIPAGLIDRLNRIAGLVPQGQLEADEVARLRMRVRSWRARLSVIEGEAAVLRDEWESLSGLVDAAEQRIAELRGSR